MLETRAGIRKEGKPGGRQGRRRGEGEEEGREGRGKKRAE